MRTTSRVPALLTMVALAFALLAWAPLVLSTQARQGAPPAIAVVPFVYVDTPALDSLETWWDASSSAREVWYCVQEYSLTDSRVSTTRGDVIWRHIEVWRLTPALMVLSTAESSLGVCGQHELIIHTHPPTTCAADGCMTGGPGADQCGPSTQDLRVVAYQVADRPIGMIQCGPRAVVGYTVP